MAREERKVGRKLPKGLCWRNGVIYVRTDPITGDYKSSGETDLKLALMWLEQRKIKKLQPAAVAAHLVTFGEALDDHVAAKKLGKVTDKTVGYIEGKIKPLRRLIGDRKPLDEIDAGTFDRYALDRARERGKRGKAVSGYTIRRELREGIAALRRQKRAGRFAGDLEVLMPTDLQASANKVDRALSEAECTAFLQALPSPRWRAYFATSVSLGLRKSETLKVGPADVEIRLEPVLDVQGFPVLDASSKPVMKKRFYVHVHGTKTKKANRIVPVLPGFDSVFEYALPELPLTHMGNEFRTFNLAAKRAGIAHCSPNDFRRSWMTILGTKGVSNEQGAQMLGHASITMAATVYNQSKATQLAPVVEGVLARAPSPIQIQLPTSERQARCRKIRNGGDDDGGNDPGDPDGSNDVGQPPSNSAGSNGGQGGEGESVALPALPIGSEWQECSSDGMKTGLACVGVANRGAPQWIRTTDLWLRRPTHNEPNSATTSNPYYYSQHQATTVNSRPLEGRDYFGTADSHLTADADHNPEAENGVGLGSIPTPEANGLRATYGGPFIIPTPEDLAAIEAAVFDRSRAARRALDAVMADPTPIGGWEQLKEMAQRELGRCLLGASLTTRRGHDADRRNNTSAPMAAGDRVPTSGRLVGGVWVHGSGPAPSLDFLSRPHGPGPKDSDPRLGSGVDRPDWSSYLAGTGFDPSGLALGVDRAAPDSERTVETLVRVRGNGLREYSTDAGSVWGWS